MMRLQGVDDKSIAFSGSERQMAQLVGNGMSSNVIEKILVEIAECSGLGPCSGTTLCRAAHPADLKVEAAHLSLSSLALRKKCLPDIENILDTKGLRQDQIDSAVSGIAARTLKRHGWTIEDVSLGAQTRERTDVATPISTAIAVIPNAAWGAEIVTNGHIQHLKPGFVHILQPAHRITGLGGMIIIRITAA